MRNLKDIIMRWLLYTAQYINRKTAWANALKRKLGLWRLADAIFVKKVNARTKQHILDSLKEDIVSKKVAQLSAQGVDDPLFVVLHIERMGDLVAAEPISRYLKKMAPKGRIRWVVKKAFSAVVSFNPYIDEVIEVDNLSQGEDYCSSVITNSKAIFVNCVFHRTACPVTNRIFLNENNPLITIFTYYAIGSLLETASLAAGLPRLTDAPQFHFRKGIRLPVELEGKSYVVFHCFSNDPSRDWGKEKWRELAAYISSKGFLVVEIGEKQALEERPGMIISLTGRRNIQDLAYVVKNSTFFLGIDSGFAHIANATRRPSVIMLGRHGNFTGQRVWSGDFAQSTRFKVVRAPGEELAGAIGVDAVKDAFDELLISGDSK